MYIHHYRQYQFCNVLILRPDKQYGLLIYTLVYICYIHGIASNIKMNTYINKNIKKTTDSIWDVLYHFTLKDWIIGNECHTLLLFLSTLYFLKVSENNVGDPITEGLV